MAKPTKGKAARASTPERPAGGMALAARWPVHEVLVSRGWEQPQELITVLIARRSPNTGKVAVGSFLIDLACLGVKSAQVKLHRDDAEYRAGLRAHIVGQRPMAPADFDLAVKIIGTGLEYAAGLGFRPDPVFAQAEPLLEGAHPDSAAAEVRAGGPDGKPLFIGGPYDDVDRILAQLRRAVGEGNFDYVLGIDPGSAPW